MSSLKKRSDYRLTDTDEWETIESEARTRKGAGMALAEVGLEGYIHVSSPVGKLQSIIA